MTSWSCTDEGSAADALQIQDISFTPDPPKPGGHATLTLKAHVPAAIEDGAYFDVVVKLGLIKLLQRRYDLGEELRKGAGTDGWSLTPDPDGGPIKPGDVVLTVGLRIPRETPQATFAVRASGYTASEDPLATVSFVFDFMR